MPRRRTTKLNQKRGYENSRSFDVKNLSKKQVQYSASDTYGVNNNYGFYNNNVNKKKTKKKWPFIVLSIVIIIIIAIVVKLRIENNKKIIKQQMAQKAYNNLVEKVTSFDNVFANGVYVDGINLSGLSYDEGKALVDANSQKKAGSWKINLLYEGKIVFSIDNNTVGYNFSSDKAINEAWKLGKSGDVYEREKELKRLAQTRTDFYSAESEVTLEKIDEVLDTIEKYSHIDPINAKLIGFDKDLDYPFVFDREVYGRDIDTSDARAEILSLLENFSSGDVELKATKITPEITVEELRKKYTLLNKTNTEISTKSTENRIENIRIAFSRYNGMRIKPGKRFSFNSIVGPRTQEKGFLEAIEYAYGELVEGFGGGVCQASSTTYLAALKSGLNIRKRYPHSMPVSYAELGQDATVYLSRDRNIDLIFENNTGHDIYIKADVIRNPRYKKRYLASVSIYGYKEDNVDYKVESLTIEELDPPMEPKYIDDKDAKYVVYTDQQKVVQSAKKGYVVESYLVKYVDGNEVDRSKISTDTYKPQQERVYVGVTPRY